MSESISVCGFLRCDCYATAVDYLNLSRPRAVESTNAQICRADVPLFVWASGGSGVVCCAARCGWKQCSRMLCSVLFESINVIESRTPVRARETRIISTRLVMRA